METDDRCLRLSPTLQQSEVLKHLPGVNHLLQTVLILELGVSAREGRQFSSTHHTDSRISGRNVLLRVIGGMFVVFPGDFGKVFWFSA